MDLLPTLGLLGLLLVKESGVPIPVPGDLLVIGAGIAAAGAGGAGPVLLAAILLAGFIGGSLQFLLVRGAFRGPIVAILARAGIPEARVDQLASFLRRRGSSGVAVARATPGLRVGAIAASGLAALPFATFLPGLVAGNGIFVSAHFALGFVLGPTALALVAGSGGVVTALVALAVLALFGAVGWRRLRARRTSQMSEAAQDGQTRADLPADLPALGSWGEAACPACLAISLIRSD